jgi:hypothetical protein
MEGRKIARKYNRKGSQVGNLLNPVRGIRDQQARRGKQVVNHARENRIKLRAAQAKNRALQDAKNQKKEDKFVMKRFKDVKSRWVKPDVKKRDQVRDEYIKQRTTEIQTARRAKDTARRQLATSRRSEIENADPIHAPSTAGPNSPPRPDMEDTATLNTARTSRRNNTPGRSKPRVPTRNETAKLAPRSKKDFVKSNLMTAVTSSPPKMAEEDVNKRVVHEDFGSVPVYIQEIKAEMAEQQRLATEKEEREKGCPPGMTRMSDAERLETLEVLKKNKGVGYDELAKLPMSIETPSLIKRKNALERKLEQIEEAIKIFSRTVVWVNEDQ